MEPTLQRLIESWDGLAVVSRHHRETRAWIFIVLHDETLGVPTGGTRIRVYPSPAEGLRDGMRLAEGMTHKWAAIDLDFGGGKGVLALSRPIEAAERESLLAEYGRLLASLHGGFQTGQDLGTTPEDMAQVRRHAPWVHGVDERTGRALDPGPYTARGVLAGIRAATAHVWGDPALADRRIVLQGAGGVGLPLARLCAKAGADLLVSDLDAELAKHVAGECGGKSLPADAVDSTACDLYAPCAVGSTLNRESIARLRCRVVAGSANNQLAEPGDADRLHDRGILYAPDFVINGGGALAFGLKARGEKNEDLIGARLDGLQATLSEIFVESAERGESPLAAAHRRVERVLARARNAR